MPWDDTKQRLAAEEARPQKLSQQRLTELIGHLGLSDDDPEGCLGAIEILKGEGDWHCAGALIQLLDKDSQRSGTAKKGPSHKPSKKRRRLEAKYRKL